MDSVGVTKISEKLHIQYMVSPGETIYGISTKYGTPVSDLLEINPELENGLKVGQVINIPYNPELKAKAPSDNSIIHKVQPGETLYGIAKKYNTSVNELMRLNNMQLKAGQDLVVGYKNKPQDYANTPSRPPSTIPKEKVRNDTALVKETKEVKEEVKEVKETKEVKEEVKEAKEVAKVPAEEPKELVVNTITPYPFDKDRKQILVIPFDPYLYFSDADAEIAAKSNIAMPKVRQMFRRRLNALLDVQGYEMIRLVGGKSKDSTSDLNKIYGSVTYGYQDMIYSEYNPNNTQYKASDNASKDDDKSWFEKKRDKMQGANTATATNYNTPKDHGKYFGVRIKDPEFFNYFKQKYDIDYYIFINQFEVKTNYENCLDRAALNYERTFTTHYSIFDANGKQIAGNKFKTNYNSNSNYIMTIVADNAPKIVERIMADVPPPNAK